jgi:hypothetical protein
MDGVVSTRQGTQVSALRNAADDCLMQHRPDLRELRAAHTRCNTDDDFARGVLQVKLVKAAAAREKEKQRARAGRPTSMALIARLGSFQDLKRERDEAHSEMEAASIALEQSRGTDVDFTTHYKLAYTYALHFAVFSSISDAADEITDLHNAMLTTLAPGLDLDDDQDDGEFDVQVPVRAPRNTSHTPSQERQQQQQAAREAHIESALASVWETLVRYDDGKLHQSVDAFASAQALEFQREQLNRHRDRVASLQSQLKNRSADEITWPSGVGMVVNEEAQLGMALLSAQTSGFGCDVSVCGSDGVCHQAHAVVLKHRSDYFRAMLTHLLHATPAPRPHGSRSVPLPQLTLVHVTSAYPLLYYLYTGQLPDNLSLVSRVELLVLADMITLYHFKDLLQQSLQRSLTVDTACFCLAAADKYQAAQLRAAVLYFIIKNYTTIRDTPAFALLPVSLRKEIRCNLPSQQEQPTPPACSIA